MLVLGYLALGLAAFGIGDGIAALHLVGIGGIGGMTLAMMSRAALGHAGLPLVAPSGTAVGYAAVALSAVVRAGAPWDGPAAYDAALLVAGGLWCLAFALFLIDYWRILTGAAQMNAARIGSARQPPWREPVPRRMKCASGDSAGFPCHHCKPRGSRP